MQNHLSGNPSIWLFTLLILVFSLEGRDAYAQVPPDTVQTSRPDTLNNTRADTLQTVRPDTLQNSRADTLQAAPPDTSSFTPGDFSQGQQPPPDMGPGQNTQQTAQNRSSEREAVEDAVNFQARDSLTFTFGEQRIAMLYGAANVDHEAGQLSSGTIELNLDESQLQATASSEQDTLSYPVLTREEQELRSTRILFNYETERGKFEVAEIDVGDGHLIGTKVKNVSRNEVFIEDGIYSTCPPEHMYYYIQAARMKVVDEEEIFFTNARLFILDIPYPLVFPFGYVPSGIEQRQSGLLEPTYAFQNTSARGIGLQNLGWFQYFSDYFTAQTSFDVFTSGTFFNETRMQYRKTGRFNGSIVLGYSKERGLESTDPGYTERTAKNLSISHDQQLSPYANISANINLRTSDYFRRNSFDLDERAETSTTSRISYRYNHPENLYNFSISSNLNQQFRTNTTRLNGPEMTFSLKQFSPFQSDRTSGLNDKWYEKISVTYRNNFESEYSFRPDTSYTGDANWLDALFDKQKYEEATGDDEHLQYGFIQRAQVSAGQIIPSRFLNVSANVNYNEYWYPTTIRKRFNEEENEIETFYESGFATARDFTTSLNFNTTFYGISQLKIGNFEGLRHTVRPTISIGYKPDFSSDTWGYYREVQTDTLGNTREYSIFEEGVVGGPSAGEQQTMSFGIDNILETKRVRRDSTGEIQSETLRLIDNFSASSNYNFAADSLNFGRMSVTLSSSVVNNFRIRANASYSFYARDENGREIDRFIWEESNKYLQPLSYSLSLSTDINIGKRGARVSTPPYRPYDPYDQTFFGPVDTRFYSHPVQDFGTPFRMGLDFSYRWTYRPNRDASKSAVLNANNISFNLTPKWSVNTRVGYDFIEKELTPSQFSLNRQMVCWNLSFQFSPFGDFQYYSFRLSLSGSQIQGLFQKLPLLNNLERSSSPNGRRPRF
ncbi:MAG: putative LPS assembly protein LptD [Balneolaceae bacterium]|nr:putative LPS assembly protein LptD [Balneolaceae bacterium]